MNVSIASKVVALLRKFDEHRDNIGFDIGKRCKLLIYTPLVGLGDPASRLPYFNGSYRAAPAPERMPP
jgi:hypothetical protein